MFCFVQVVSNVVKKVTNRTTVLKEEEEVAKVVVEKVITSCEIH